MRRTRALLLPWLCLTLSCAGEEPAEETDGAQQAVGQAPVASYFVVLDGAGAVKAIPPGVDPRSAEAAAATKKQLHAIEAEQAAMEARVVAEGGQVIARLTRLTNALQILADDVTAERISRLSGVRRVERVPVLERSLLSAVPTVGAPKVWAGTPGLTGEGIVIGVIDSGIDYTHADFGGVGTVAAYADNDSTMVEVGSFPTAKVIGGWDFAGDAFNPSGGNASPNPDADPLDCTTPGGEQISGGHGTHVAGIAAGMGVAADGSTFDGPYEATLNPNAFRVGPGVAPGASLYALKVFGCEGSTTLLTSALDRAADPNMDGSFDDRIDVLNASLGTSYALGADVTGDMISELTAVGTLVVVAAGNDGQNFFAGGSPAAYPEVLAVAASVDNNLIDLSVTSPPSAVAELPAAEGLFTLPLSVTGALAGELVLAEPALGCSAFVNAANVAGKVALIRRGTCPFVDKFANAVAAGAVAAVIINDDDDVLPFAMFGENPTTIPGVMIALDDGNELVATLASGPVTIGLDAADRYTGPGAELLANFSSRGPSAVDGRLKPEITAPGQDIASAGVGSGTEARTSQGTSQACPMVAGAAALVRQAQPSLSPFKVKAALMNAAVPLRDFSLAPYSTTVVGAGRMDVERAVQSEVGVAVDLTGGEVGVSFGSVIAIEEEIVTRTFEVSNRGAAVKTLDLTIAPTFTTPGVVVTVEPAQLVLETGAKATAELTLTFDPVLLGDALPDPGTPAMQGMQTPQPRHYLNQASGLVRIANGASEAVLPYTGSVRAASNETVFPPSACDASALPEEPTTLVRQDDGAHPNSVVSAFQLVELDSKDGDSDDDPVAAMSDLRAVGVATNLASAESYNDAMVYFGVAVEGPWATAARGPLSVVKIRVDSDQSGSTDFEIRVEARNPDGPFRDALVASVYDASTGERGERYPVNIIGPDLARTYPFNSTVLVIPASLDELEIDEDNPAFEFSARTERADLLASGDSVSGSFDAKNPLVDTAVHGLEGQPIFLGTDQLRVQLAEGALEAEDPPKVLLLHHTNRPGQQWEVIDLAKGERGNLTLTSVGPSSLTGEDTGEVTYVVSNPTEVVASSVVLTADAVGGEILEAITNVGSCTVGASLECALGDLAPGANSSIEVTLRGKSASVIALAATVASDLPCELDEGDNTNAVTITVVAGPEHEPDNVFEPTGGCDCTTASPSTSRFTWLGLAIGGLIAWRRKRVV